MMALHYTQWKRIPTARMKSVDSYAPCGMNRNIEDLKKPIHRAIAIVPITTISDRGAVGSRWDVECETDRLPPAITPDDAAGRQNPCARHWVQLEGRLEPTFAGSDASPIHQDFGPGLPILLLTDGDPLVCAGHQTAVPIDGELWAWRRGSRGRGNPSSVGDISDLTGAHRYVAGRAAVRKHRHAGNEEGARHG
jgi:hypothetical protein